jgi:hypothetical protein
MDTKQKKTRGTRSAHRTKSAVTKFKKQTRGGTRVTNRGGTPSSRATTVKKTTPASKKPIPAAYKEEAISWTLHSLKIILGDESIRRYILLKYLPNLVNSSKDCLRTFDAFVPSGKTREDKAREIQTYCQAMLKKKGTVVFTATNIQMDENDNETHFQSYIIDNTKRTLIAIDPAYDIAKENHAGIYMSEVTDEVIAPFFRHNHYDVQFMDLTHPAQIHDKDVFCQSWSLFILLEKLKNNEYKTDITFVIPETQLDKYKMLLGFYQQLFRDLPELGDNLRAEYKGEVSDTLGAYSSNQDAALTNTLLTYDPVHVLANMTAEDLLG